MSLKKQKKNPKNNPKQQQQRGWSDRVAYLASGRRS
jgi:hypothetical protein